MVPGPAAAVTTGDQDAAIVGMRRHVIALAAEVEAIRDRPGGRALPTMRPDLATCRSD
jgi:hypothetical protein